MLCLPTTLTGRPERCRTALATLALVTLAACQDGVLLSAPEVRESTTMVPSAPRADLTAKNFWAARPSMPTERGGAVAAAVGGNIYVIGGEVNGGKLRTVEVYFPGSELVAWAPKAPLPQARAFPSGAAVIGGKIYVPGGFNAQGNSTRSLFVYDAAANAWTGKALLPAGSAAGIAAAIQGRLYVFTPILYGSSATAAFRPVVEPSAGDYRPRLYRYNPGSNSWTELAIPPRNRIHGVGGAIDGKFYLAGGWNADGLVAALDVYDPATNEWTTKVPIPTPRRGAAGQVLDGKLYVVGGVTADYEIRPTLQLYDPQRDTWATRASMPTARHFLAAAAAGGRLYALGGASMIDSGAHAENEVYLP